jgi:hypothetical protein
LFDATEEALDEIAALVEVIISALDYPSVPAKSKAPIATSSKNASNKLPGAWVARR